VCVSERERERVCVSLNLIFDYVNASILGRIELFGYIMYYTHYMKNRSLMQQSPTKETYILQNRPIFLSDRQIIATQYV